VELFYRPFKKQVVSEIANSSFVDPQQSEPSDDWTIHHGDKHDPKLSCRLINVNSDSTGTGDNIPHAWNADGKMSVPYLVKASVLQVQGDKTDETDPRLHRVVLADEDAARVCIAVMHSAIPRL
jgi:hypothetical protein